MANERRSEPAEPPFWSTMWDRANTGAALADSALGGIPSAAAGLVNSAVAPVVNPFLPDDYKLAPTFSGIQEKKEEALKGAPGDFRALTEQYMNPGNAAGLLEDAGQAMLVSLGPALRRLRKAGRISEGDKRGMTEAMERTLTTSQTPLQDLWRDHGVTSYNAFAGKGMSGRVAPHERGELMMNFPGLGAYKGAPTGITEGRLPDLFEMSDDLRLALPPGARDIETRVEIDPDFTTVGMGRKNFFNPAYATDLESPGLSIYAPDPEAARVFASHEGQHAAHLMEPGRFQTSKVETTKDFKDPGRKEENAVSQFYNLISEEDPYLQKMAERAYSSGRYDNMPVERIARWEEGNTGLSLDDIRENRAPFQNDDFFHTPWRDSIIADRFPDALEAGLGYSDFEPTTRLFRQD